MIKIEEIVQPIELCVKDIFKDTKYVVPIYQRNYAWTKDEIEQLLNDINDVPKEGKYYLGSLIVNQSGANVFEVIDGQQRLTTLFLLLSYLNDDDASINKNSLEFEAREKSTKTLQYISAIKNINGELAKKSWYSAEIIQGYSIIKNYFLEKPSKYNNDFRDNLGSIKIIRTQVPKDIDLNHYFEIMNTRGEQLELHEIVKAKIIGAIKSDDKQVTEIDKMIAATIWDACAQMDKYVQMSFSVAVREQLFGDNWDTFNCQEYKDVRDAFSNAFNDKKQDNENQDNETEFILGDKLQKPERSKENNNNSEEENQRFESIISFPNFILQVNEAMKPSESVNEDGNGLDDKRFLERLKKNWESNENALKFIYSLLKYRYLFDRYIIKREYIGKYKVEGKWMLQSLEKCKYNNGKKAPLYKSTIDKGTEDEENNKQLKMLQACLRITYTSPKTMHWIAKVLSEVNPEKTEKQIISIKEIISILEKYCCDKIEKSDYLHSTGFAIDRIVFTYLDYILYRDNTDEFKDFQFRFRTSIEHFYPQHPINDKNIVGEKNRDSFGNLALITVSANSRFSNLLPSQKVEYKEEIEQSPKLMRMKKLLDDNNRVWDDTLVNKHYNEMIKLLKEEIE